MTKKRKGHIPTSVGLLVIAGVALRLRWVPDREAYADDLIWDMELREVDPEIVEKVREALEVR